MNGQRRDPSAHGRPPPPRRLPTRWLLITPLVALVVVIGLVVGLEATHPQVDPREAGLALSVEGLPDLASDDVHTCLRRADETEVDTIRDSVPAGGRVSSTQVVACPMAFDGLQVTFAGEIVGELLRRDGGVWAQVNDDDYAFEVGPVIGHREHRGFNTGLAVWLPHGLHEQLEAPGRAGVRGDVILVTGTFHQADAADGGGMSIRAESLERLAAPVTIDPPLHVAQVIAAILLALAATGALIASRRSER